MTATAAISATVEADLSQNDDDAATFAQFGLPPALMAALQLTGVLLAGESIASEFVWLRLLLGFDLIFTVLAAALVDGSEGGVS